MLKYCTTAPISHANKVLIKILQARLQQNVNHEISDIQAKFRKGRGPGMELPTSSGSSKKQESSRETSTSAFLTMSRPLTVDHNKLWKILKEIEIPDHLICLLRNLYAGQEATVRTGRGTTDWFQIGKGVRQSCIFSPCLLNFFVGLDEAQAGIKIAGRNTNNFRYAGDTTLMAESEEELQCLLMRVKQEIKKDGLKLNIQKAKIMALGPITSWQIDGETVEPVTDYFLDSKFTADDNCNHDIKRRLLLGRKVLTKLDSILNNRGITLPTKVHLVKDMVLPIVMYGCESWNIKQAEC